MITFGLGVAVGCLAVVIALVVMDEWLKTEWPA